MTDFDSSQLRVLNLDPAQHARILGAPGTGKTAVLVEMYARTLEREDWSETDVLVIAPSRLGATSLRAAIEKRTQRALGGAAARSPEAFAFSILAQSSATAGTPAPRLLTGNAHDEVVSLVIEQWIARRLESESELVTRSGPLSPEMLRSSAFRSELREFSRVIDDFDLDSTQVVGECRELAARAAGSAVTESPDEMLLERWMEALPLVAEVELKLHEQRPGELSSSALLREAARELRAGHAAAPRLILIDDAQELGEGHLALLAECAGSGSAIWAFGDPDIATESFRGERVRVMSGLARELARRGARAAQEQAETLEFVHRHGNSLRKLVHDLTNRIGAAGGAPQRGAGVQGLPDVGGVSGTPDRGLVDFVAVASRSEQLGVVAHRLRSRRLAINGGDALAWRSMAVICRSRADAKRFARALTNHQVPTHVVAGGIEFREDRVVRDLMRLLQHARGIAPLDARAVLDLLSGPIGGLDPVSIRRLRGALMLQERRRAREEQRTALNTDALVLEAFLDHLSGPAIDSGGGRALCRLGALAAAGGATAATGGTPRETLWAIWDRTRLAEKWQTEALSGRGYMAEEAHASLDAVLGLFFALQRHEEQGSTQPLEELLEDLLESAVPEDSLAQRAPRDAVTVTTPQGAVGREFELVAVVGAQEGTWPNSRARGSLLGTVAFERWQRGGEPTHPSRLDTIHDELRLFAQSCSRARDELLVVAIDDDENQPSPFFRYGREYLREGLPSSRLTLRGKTAEMRRRLIRDPGDQVALDALVALAGDGVPGAHPDEWYGVMPPSTDAPLYDLSRPESSVPVSPSQIERAEECPLNWAIGSLGGGESTVTMNLGTLVHHAFETVEGHDAIWILETIENEWHKLQFDADWDAERTRRTAATMAENISGYLREFEASRRQLVGRETGFSVMLGQAELRGTVDRIESIEGSAGAELTVIDLKTGAKLPSNPETQRLAQLQAYQLAILLGAFAESSGIETSTSAGARLLFVHPDSARDGGYVERAQAPLDADTQNEISERISHVAHIMAASSFTARVEHHCSDSYQFGNCRIHIVPAVSFE